MLPDQVIDEFERNRETKIAEALKALEPPKATGAPIIARDLPEFEELQKSQEAVNSARKSIVRAVREKASRRELEADKLVSEIFASGEKLETTDKILERAKRRVAIGNPPGKNGSLGDAINWECIKEKLSFIEDVHFVSQDSDYRSPIDDDAFNAFLKQEWDRDVVGAVHFYSSLRAFLAKHFPKAKFEQFELADQAVRAFEESGSFAMTHAAVANAAAVGEFTPNQVRAIIDAAYSNSQISWISSDSDLQDFFRNLIVKYSKQLRKGDRERLKKLIEAGEMFS